MTIELETAAHTHDIDFSEGTRGAGGTAHSDAGFSGSPDKNTEGTGGTANREPPLGSIFGDAVDPLCVEPEPDKMPERERPFFWTHVNGFSTESGRTRPAGLYYHSRKTSKDDVELVSPKP